MAIRHLALSAALALLICRLASAQQVTTGAIGGRVTDKAAVPLPGATVSVTSQQGAKTTTTDSAGRFLAPYLTPGMFAVRVDLTGYRPAERTGIDVRLGQRVEVAVTLVAGTFEDAVEVTGASPVVDYSSYTSGASLEGSFLAQVPVGRQLGDVLYLAPGVSNSGGVGIPNPSISGASGMENQYVVDGVTVNHPRYGTLGAYATGYGAIGNGVTFDFIDEIQVKTGGTEAEYGQSTGGVVNVITKSGSNTWSGSVFAYLRPDWLEAERRQITLAAGAVNTTATETGELGFTLGGPIVKDRAFFFVAVDPQREQTTFLAPAGFELRSLGNVDRQREVTSYAAKATFTPSGGHRIDASVFGDPGAGEMGPQSAGAMAFRSNGAFSSLEYGGHNQTLRYQGVLGASWLIEASVGRAQSTFSETPAVDTWQVTDYTTSPAKSSGGKGGFQKNADGLSMQYHLRSTHLLGHHEIRYGASYEDVHYSYLEETTGSPITLANGQQTGSGVVVTIRPDPTYGRIFRVTSGRQVPLRKSTQESLSFFLQDRFSLGSRVTLSAGIRYERQRIAGPAGSRDLADTLAPRLGVVLDPTGDGRMKLYAGAGFYYARMPNSLPVLAFGSGGWRLLLADYFDEGLTRPVPDGVEAAGSTTHLILGATQATRFDRDVSPTSIREATVGFEYAVLPQLNLGVRYIYRDMPDILEDVGTAAMVLVFAKDPAAQSVEYYVTNPRDGYPATVNGVGAFEKLVHRYRALELTVDRRFSGNWALLGSYRWSRLWGNYEGFYRNDNNQSAAGQSSIHDFPTNDPTYTEIGGKKYEFRGDIRYLGAAGAGPLPTDRPHQLKLYGSYAFDGGLRLGLGVSASSGRPLTPMAANPVTNRRGEIPEAPRGSGIETQDGFKKRTPFGWSLDLHADYAFRLAPGRLVLLADVFNLLDRQQVTDYDADTERTFRVANPDYGRRTRYQEPRQVRLGLRFEL
ncbi:MAG: TonB-dependent receptor [Acidobacteriota bacterium]